MAQTDDPLSRDRLIQALRRQLEAGIAYPLPPGHKLAGGRGDCVLEVIAIRDERRDGQPAASVTWSVHPKGGRFYDAGAVNGNTPVDQLGNRFPFLFVEGEQEGWAGVARLSGVKKA